MNGLTKSTGLLFSREITNDPGFFVFTEDESDNEHDTSSNTAKNGINGNFFIILYESQESKLII